MTFPFGSSGFGFGFGSVGDSFNWREKIGFGRDWKPATEFGFFSSQPGNHNQFRN